MSGLQESRIQPIQGPASEKPIDMGLERKQMQGRWLILKDNLLQAQESYSPMCRKSSKGSKRAAWMNTELLTKLKHKTNAYKRWEQGQVS